MKKKALLLGLTTVAVDAVYRAVKGHGVYNRIKYPKEHEAVSKYLKDRRPYATYSSSEYAYGTYSTKITDGIKKFVLTFQVDENGQFIFEEKEMSI